MEQVSPLLQRVNERHLLPHEHGGGCTTAGEGMGKWSEHSIHFLPSSRLNAIYSECTMNSFNNKDSEFATVNNCMPVSFLHCLLSGGITISPFLSLLFSSLTCLEKSPEALRAGQNDH